MLSHQFLILSFVFPTSDLRPLFLPFCLCGLIYRRSRLDRPAAKHRSKNSLKAAIVYFLKRGGGELELNIKCLRIDLFVIVC